jgi:adenylylsulfate kinase
MTNPLTATYVLMAGLPGSGKSTLAQALARELNGVVLSKDTIRAALFPGQLTDYTLEQDDLCFEMVLQAANYLAARSRVRFLFLDGRTFSRREQIEVVIRAAESTGCKWKILHAVCPDAVAEARLMDDVDHPACNRTVALYREVKGRFEPISRAHEEIDTSQSLDVCVQFAVKYLRG